MRLLSPAGDMDSLKQAVYNGADEVYLGVNNFNARNNIAGFTLESLREAVNFAHAYKVKVLLAVNILFPDDELQAALDVVCDAHNMGVDAFIVQDIGLAALIKKHYPSLELHASTQMAIHNLEGVLILERLGFKRVVLARETGLDEIKRIKQNSKIELEYFVHGALCVSFSGNCYLSSYECDASGNRGRCKQLCRLKYKLEYKPDNAKIAKTAASGYLLSTKDIKLLDELTKLENAGVFVLKIEGRARRPFYVAAVTELYRKALDCKIITKEDEDNILIAFNRGFTPAYFSDNKVLAGTSASKGLFIGKVEKVNPGKKFSEVWIKTKYPIMPKSGLKFFRSGIETSTVSPHDIKRIDGGTVYFTTAENDIQAGDYVHIFMDSHLEKAIESKMQKLPVSVNITAKEGEPVKVELSARGVKYSFVGDNLQPAKSSPLKIEDLKEAFKKSPLFTVKQLTVKLSNVFMTKAQLNELRRSAYDGLTNELCKHQDEKLNKVKIENDYLPRTLKNFKVIENACEIKEKINYIFNPEKFDKEIIAEAEAACKKCGAELFLNLPYFATKSDVEKLKTLVENKSFGIILNNLYAICFDANKKVIGPGMNVYNTHSAKYFDLPVLTAEAKISGVSKLKAPYMTLRHCPMREHLGAKCSECNYTDGYVYVMQSGKRLKLKRQKVENSCTFYLL